MINDLEKLGWAVNESLRIEPPVLIPIGNTPFDEIKLNDGFTLKKGSNFTFNFYRLHHNPDEWRQPDEFRPDRFNSKSMWYLTPEGNKRNSFSFMPFSAGRRSCAGKTFAETLPKLVLAYLLHEFDFEMANPDHKIEKPMITVQTVKPTKIPVLIRKRER